jgi:hypothetical protein
MHVLSGFLQDSPGLGIIIAPAAAAHAFREKQRLRKENRKKLEGGQVRTWFKMCCSFLLISLYFTE